MKYTKKKLLIILPIIILLIIFFFVGKYFFARAYFKGAVDSYINAQQIPASQIQKKKIDYNWINMGMWEEHVTVYSNGKRYNYVYTMPSNKAPLVLEITKGKNKDYISNLNKLEYPPLAYDK